MLMACNGLSTQVLFPKQATLLPETATLSPFSATKSPVSGFKVARFGNKCGQALRHTVLSNHKHAAILLAYNERLQ